MAYSGFIEDIDFDEGYMHALIKNVVNKKAEKVQIKVYSVALSHNSCSHS